MRLLLLSALAFPLMVSAQTSPSLSDGTVSNGNVQTETREATVQRKSQRMGMSQWEFNRRNKPSNVGQRSLSGSKSPEAYACENTRPENRSEPMRKTCERLERLASGSASGAPAMAALQPAPPATRGAAVRIVGRPGTGRGAPLVIRGR